MIARTFVRRQLAARGHRRDDLVEDGIDQLLLLPLRLVARPRPIEGFPVTLEIADVDHLGAHAHLVEQALEIHRFGMDAVELAIGLRHQREMIGRAA